MQTQHATTPTTDHPRPALGGYFADGFAGVATIAQALEVAAVYGAPASTLSGLAVWLEGCARDADAAVDSLIVKNGLDLKAAEDPAAPGHSLAAALSAATAAVGPIEGAAAVLRDLARVDAPSGDALRWLAFTLDKAARSGRVAIKRGFALLPPTPIGNA